MISLIRGRGLLGWGETTVPRGRPDRADIKGVASDGPLESVWRRGDRRLPPRPSVSRGGSRGHSTGSQPELKGEEASLRLNHRRRYLAGSWRKTDMVTSGSDGAALTETEQEQAETRACDDEPF